MEKYESKQHQIRRSADQIYTALSSFSNFTPMLADKVEEWSADEDSCSFKLKGMTARLRIVDREPNKTIKIQGDEGSPVDFTFFQNLQLAEAGEPLRVFRGGIDIEFFLHLADADDAHSLHNVLLTQ